MLISVCLTTIGLIQTRVPSVLQGAPSDVCVHIRESVCRSSGFVLMGKPKGWPPVMFQNFSSNDYLPCPLLSLDETVGSAFSTSVVICVLRKKMEKRLRQRDAALMSNSKRVIRPTRKRAVSHGNSYMPNNTAFPGKSFVFWRAAYGESRVAAFVAVRRNRGSVPRFS